MRCRMQQSTIDTNPTLFFWVTGHAIKFADMKPNHDLVLSLITPITSLLLIRNLRSAIVTWFLQDFVWSLYLLTRFLYHFMWFLHHWFLTTWRDFYTTLRDSYGISRKLYTILQDSYAIYVISIPFNLTLFLSHLMRFHHSASFAAILNNCLPTEI